MDNMQKENQVLPEELGYRLEWALDELEAALSLLGEVQPKELLGVQLIQAGRLEDMLLIQLRVPEELSETPLKTLLKMLLEQLQKISFSATSKSVVSLCTAKQKKITKREIY